MPMMKIFLIRNDPPPLGRGPWSNLDRSARPGGACNDARMFFAAASKRLEPRARFRASVISALTRVFRRAMRAQYRVAALAARFARQCGPRRERPSGRRPAEQRDERAASFDHLVGSDQ